MSLGFFVLVMLGFMVYDFIGRIDAYVLKVLKADRLRFRAFHQLTNFGLSFLCLNICVPSTMAKPTKPTMSADVSG